MEYRGLWEEDTSNDTPKTIYKVTEFYDWHNCDPEIDTTIFQNKDLALGYMQKRIEEVPKEVFDYDIDQIEKYVHKSYNPNGSICINDDNDYWTISLERDEIVTSIYEYYG